jgi:hypothetical protein
MISTIPISTTNDVTRDMAIPLLATAGDTAR